MYIRPKDENLGKVMPAATTLELVEAVKLAEERSNRAMDELDRAQEADERATEEHRAAKERLAKHLRDELGLEASSDLEYYSGEGVRVGPWFVLLAKTSNMNDPLRWPVIHRCREVEA